MRKILLAACAIGALAVPTVASAQYYSTADVYAPPPATTYVAPGTTYVTPPPAYLAPGTTYVAPAAPMVDSQVYLAPGQTYVQPGTVYQDQAIVIEGRRYYRDCWWDWGQRRCELKPWW